MAKRKKKKYDGPELWISEDGSGFICCLCKEICWSQYYKPHNSNTYCAPCWESIPFDSDNEFGEQEVVQAFGPKIGLVVGGAPIGGYDGWPGGWLQVLFDGEPKTCLVWHQHLSYTAEGRVSRKVVA